MANGYYIDSMGRLVYTSCGQTSEIWGVELDGNELFFKVKLIW